MNYLDLKGTTSQTLQIQKGGAKFKNLSGEIAIRNAADGADANLITAMLKNSGDSFEINSDATGIGADRKYTIARPAAGMAANLSFILPINAGANTNVLTTDGAGNLYWAAPTIPSGLQMDVTDLVFGSVSPVAMFDLAATAIIDEIKVVIDTAFDGAPTLEIGIVGTTDKYMTNTQVDLTSVATTGWVSSPNLPAAGVLESLIATYAAGGALVGAARILTKFVIPS